MKIHCIETGKVKVKLNQMSKPTGFVPPVFKILFGKDWSEWLPIYAWVIEHEEGIIVVDTGETARTSEKGYFPTWHPYFSMAVQLDVKPEDEIGPQLKKLGIHPEKDVKKVILTHLHTDHAGGMAHFPNAEIIIEKTEWATATGKMGKLVGYVAHRWPDWLKPTLIELPDTPHGPFTKSLPITKDGKITVVNTPGHVPTHLSVIVEDNGIHYFLAGDTSYTQSNLLLLLPDGVSSKEAMQTLENILAFAEKHPTVYLPSHDPEAEKRLAGKQVLKF